MVDILELVLTDILEADAEPDETALRVFLHTARHANTARFRQCLQPCCYVYAVAMDAGAFNDIANVDSHPEIDLPIGRYLRIALPHCALDLYGATQRIHGTDEQDQQAVAGCPYNPATVFFNLRFNELSVVSV